MFRTHLLLLSILFNTMCFAQNTLLFKVEGKTLAKPAFIFGTMHVTDEKAFGFGDAVYDAIDQCEIASFEINLSNSKSVEMSQSIANDSALLELKSFFKKEFPLRMKQQNLDEKDLTAKFIRIYGQILNTYLKPSEESNRVTFVDAFLTSYAMHQRKEIMGIETSQEQLKYLMNFNKDQLLDSIITFLKKPDWDEQILGFIESTERLKDNYASLKLTNICVEVNEYPDSKWMNDLLYIRNEIMIERMLPIMERKAVFMAIGAGHLCGERGILALLKAKGFKVTPVDIAGKIAPIPLAWNTFENKEEEGFIAETPNSILTETDNLNPYYVAADTNRKGIVYFTVFKSIDDGPEQNDWIMEETDLLDIDFDTFIPSGDETPYEIDSSEVMYGDDIIGEAILEEELPENEEMTESLNEQMMLEIEKLMANTAPEEKSDTFYLEGVHGKIEIYRNTNAGRTELVSCFQSKDEKYADLWILKIWGDPALVNDERLLRFFTTFKLTY